MKSEESAGAGEVGDLASEERRQGRGCLLWVAFMGKTSHVRPPDKGSRDPRETGRRG